MDHNLYIMLADLHAKVDRQEKLLKILIEVLTKEEETTEAEQTTETPTIKPKQKQE